LPIKYFLFYFYSYETEFKGIQGLASPAGAWAVCPQS